MRHSKAFVLLTALLLCALATAAALEGGPLTALWDSGCALLFHTDNVTVTGEASFALDGEHFKTARLHYVQDGRRSFYDLALRSPRANGSERENGWTIIADEKGNYYVMEVYEPGVYRTGSGSTNNTLLRRSVQLDALVGLGGLLVGQIEPTLPEGAVTSTEADGGRAVHIALAGDQIPPVAVDALNTAASLLCNRWFFYGYEWGVTEDEGLSFDSHVTVTQALTYGTVRWTLRDVDATFTLDAQGRLTGAKGSATVASTYWDESVREVTVRFDLAVKDYGISRVKAFDPADYGVTLPQEYFGENAEDVALDEAAWDAWMDRAAALLRAQGYTVSPVASWGGWTEQGAIKISIENPDEDAFFCAFAEDGSLITLQHVTGAWLSGEEGELAGVDTDALAEAEKLIRSFVAEHNPALAESLGELTPQNLIAADDGGRYLTIDAAGEAFFVVRIDPSLRLEYCTGDSNG